jgi:hypothetical protein
MQRNLYSHLDFSASSRTSNVIRWCCCRAIIDGVRNDESVTQGSGYRYGQQVSKNRRKIPIRSCIRQDQQYEINCSILELDNNRWKRRIMKSLGTMERFRVRNDESSGGD